MKYYVNNNVQNNGDHEVHHQYHKELTKIKNKKYLGDYDNCLDAVFGEIKNYEKDNSYRNGCSGYGYE
jgi:hypothetical protein